MNFLKEKKLVDDFALSQKIIEKLKDKGKGFYYILRELERRKIKDEIIEKFKKEYNFDEELERCKRVIEKLKGKKIETIILNLKNKGFSENTIEKIQKYILKNS